MITGVLAALLSALCYGVAAVLQAKAASAQPSGGHADPRLLFRLLRSAPFVGGLVLDVAGFAAQFAALRVAPVFLVQAAQAASLAVTAVVAAPLLGVRLRSREWIAIAAVSGGLALLGLSAGLEGATETAAAFGFVLIGAVLVLAVLGLLAGRRPDPGGSAVLGLVAGLGFGVVALAARALTDLSFGALLRNPATYALGLAGVVAFQFYAAGLQRGAVTVVTAAVVIGETVAPAIVGVLVFGDHTRAGMAPLAVAGFVIALVGAFGLTRFGQVSQDGTG
jgi:drug/metabolite transporter (DMT)-like permease